MNFAVSTAAFRGKSIESVIELAAHEKLTLEFSSGLPFRADMEAVYLNAQVPRLPHNYFPAPLTPFVLNLASLNDEIWEKSWRHCLRGLQLAAESKAPFFSAHAGFCVDPSPKELGKKFEGAVSAAVAGRDRYWERFLTAVRKLTAEAERLGVGFYVENNVCVKSNILPDGTSSLLCTDAEETARLVKEIGSPALKILVDTGHLKVSAQTFDFSPVEFLRTVHRWVGAFHHSDNDGMTDSNQPLDKEYWFLPYMADFKEAFHVLEVCDQSLEQIRAQYALLETAALRANQEGKFQS